MGNRKKPLSMRQRALRAMYRTAKELFYAASLLAGLIVPTPTLASGVDALVSDVCKTSSDAAFRAKYCQAAKDNKKGYVANKATAAVWGGVSAICLAGCAKTYSAGGLICKYSSTGGSLTDGAITKNFVSALTGEAGNSAKSLIGGSAESAAADATGKFNADACTTAGTTALKSYEKISNSKQNEKSLSDLRDQTKEMNTGKNGGPTIDASAGTKLGVNQEAATADVCSEGALGSALGSIRCAASQDPSLPPYVKSEQFLKDLSKSTGKSPDDFFAGFETPAKSLFDSPAMGSFSESGQTGAAAALRDMEKSADRRTQLASKDGSDGYRSAGGSVKPSGEDSDGFDVNGVISNLMNGMKPNEQGEAPAGVNIASVGGDRRPAGIVSPEDRTISIFDRVKWRYGAVSARDHLGER